jgi:hypothetical protein
MSYGFIIHTDFDEILAEVAKLQEGDKAFKDEVITFVNSIRDLTFKVEPAMKLETKDERQLWEQYQQIQREKLVLLDRFHEYESLEENMKQRNPRLDFLIKDALGELEDHLNVLAETQRAHIDILEISNTRRIAIIALVITTVISYLAVWEFFVRDLLTSFVFPYGWSPLINYVLVFVTLSPVLFAIGWAWLNRGKRF